MPSFNKDPFREETRLEDEWFEKDKPTWKPPPRQSSRPPADDLDQEVEGWFV